MAKGSILSDTFEQLAELGQSSAKKTVKSVAQTFNPLTAGDKSEKPPLSSRTREQSDQVEGSKKNNHTPLDFEKLKNQYEKNDSQNTDYLRQRLFQLVRQGDEKILYEKRQKEIGKKKQEEAMEQQKKKEKEKKKKILEQGDIPKGKVRRSIFSPKKTAERQHQETRPSIGKQ